MIHVVIVDDHASYRGALAFLLDREDDLGIVGHAGTVAEARSLVETTPIDVALVDLELPDGCGLDVLPSLCAHNPDAAAIVLTGSARSESPALAVAAGAVGFLHKSVEVAAIGDAVRRAADGEILFSAAEAVALMRQAMQVQAATEAAQRALSQLTHREREVLVALASGLDNQRIGERLYISSETVHSHVNRILRKLGVDSRLQAALIAVRYGLVDLDELL